MYYGMYVYVSMVVRIGMCNSLLPFAASSGDGGRASIRADRQGGRQPAIEGARGRKAAAGTVTCQAPLPQQHGGLYIPLESITNSISSVGRLISRPHSQPMSSTRLGHPGRRRVVVVVEEGGAFLSTRQLPVVRVLICGHFFPSRLGLFRGR